VEYQFHFSSVFEYSDLLLNGLWLTIQLSVLAALMGVVIGTLSALARVYGNGVLRALAGGYVESIRNTPFLVQLFFIYFGLPGVGIEIEAYGAALLAMTINIGAYFTEIIRAGLLSIHSSQWEAGQALGLSRRQVFLHVILPPALGNVFSSMSNQFVLVMLGSCVVSQISAEELTFAANFVQSRTFLSFETYLVVTLIYLLLAIASRLLLGWIERRWFRYRFI